MMRFSKPRIARFVDRFSAKGMSWCWVCFQKRGVGDKKGDGIRDLSGGEEKRIPGKRSVGFGNERVRMKVKKNKKHTRNVLTFWGVLS